MFELLIFGFIIVYAISKNTGFFTDVAAKRRKQQWQRRQEEAQHIAEQRTAKIATKERVSRPKQVVSQSPAKRERPASAGQAKSRTAAAPRPTEQTATRKAAPAPLKSPQAPVRRHRQPVALQAHESALQRDARLHRKPLRPPKSRLTPPRRRLK